VKAGVPALYCELPFLTGAPKAVMILIHSLLERRLLQISKNVSQMYKISANRELANLYL
jgi:hypothetical protein